MATSDLPRDDLIKHLRNLERRLAVVEQRDSLANTGLTVPGAGEVDVNGLLKVLGNLIVSGLAVVDATGGLQTSNYVSNTSGVRISGTALELNTGTVGIGALPVIPQGTRAIASNFPITTTYSTLASSTVTVPAGMTQLTAIVNVSMYAVNPNTTGGADSTGTDALYARVNLSGNVSTATPTGVSGGNGYATAFGFDEFDLSGLTPGASLTISVQGKTAFANIGASANNVSRVAAVLIWAR